MLQFIPLIVLWASLSAGKAAFQGFFLRKEAKNSTDNLLFNCLIFWAAAIAMTAIFCRALPSWETILFGAAFGACSILYQYLYGSAMECGPLSLTVMFNTFYIVITIVAGLLWFDDALTATGVVGIALMAVSLLFLLGGKKEEKSVNLRWLLLAGSSMLLAGALSVEMRFFRETASGGETGAFVSVAYLVAGALSIPIYFASNHKAHRTISLCPKTILYAVLPGLLLGLYQIFQLYLIPHVPASVLYPTCNGSVTMLSALIGAVFFHDRLTRRQGAGMLFGTAAIVLVSI